MLSNFVVPRIHGSVLPPGDLCIGEIIIGHPNLIRLGWILSITADELYRCNGYNKSREMNYNQQRLYNRGLLASTTVNICILVSD